VNPPTSNIPGTVWRPWVGAPEDFSLWTQTEPGVMRQLGTVSRSDTTPRSWLFRVTATGQGSIPFSNPTAACAALETAIIEEALR
jgi:hypothetical protein